MHVHITLYIHVYCMYQITTILQCVLYIHVCSTFYAYIQAARSYGYALVCRTPGEAIISTPSHHLLAYDILHVLEFDSERKCMSVILREKRSSRIVLYSKGADTTIFSNLAHPDSGVVKEEEEGEEGGVEERALRRELTEQHLTLYAREGLRTLCMARRVSMQYCCSYMHLKQTVTFSNMFLNSSCHVEKRSAVLLNDV